MLLPLENLFYSIAKHSTVALKLFTYHGKIMMFGSWIHLTNLGLSLQIILYIIVAFLHRALALSYVEQQLQELHSLFTAGQQMFKQLVCI